jgi:ubiquitin-conjugating enzyme E2 J1
MPAWGIRTAIVALRAFMETDAKGQLGGLDTTDVERRRIAEGTGNWKCQSCGRSNKEILGECAEAARELGRNGEERAEEKVPEELKIGFKDEKKEKAELANPAVPPTAQQSNVKLPTPVSPVANPQQSPNPTSPIPNLRLNATPASPIAQRNPIPTSPTPQQQAIRVQLQQRSTDGLIWVDRAILGVVICLVLMVVKRVLGL